MIKKPGNSFHQLLKRIVHELLKVSALRFAALFLVVAVLLSMVIVLAIDFLWDGRFSAELEFAGVVTPFLDGLFLVVFLTSMFDEIREEVALRKLAAEAMHMANIELSLFRKLLDNSNDAIEVIDPRTARFLDVNEKACRDLGYSREEMLSMSIFDIDPAFSQDARAMLDKQLQKSGSARFEAIHRRKDGSTFAVESSAVLVEIDKPYVLNIVRDITERKRLELDKEQYLKLFNLSINPMCMADPNGCLKQVNPAFVQLTGYSESELIAKPFLDFVLPEDRQRTGDEMKLQVENRPTLHFDNRYLCKDGTVIDLSWTAYYDRHDGITYATAIDITERKRTEEALRKLSQAVEQSPNSIVITDLKANIEYVNEGFIKITGYSHADVAGQNPRLLQSGKTPRATYDDMWAHLTRGEAWKGELINRRKDGSEYIESALISPVRQADGRVTHYLAIKEDITQFKQAQEELQVSRENLHLLLDSIAEGAYGVDTNGDCTFVNRAFLQMLGYQNDSAVLGKHIHELIHHSRADGSSYPENECKAYRAYRVPQSINVSDEVFWRKDGVAIPVEYWSHPILSDGATIGAIVTFVDITERKQTDAALRESELAYRTLAQNMPGMVYRVFVREGNRMEIYNKISAQITGYLVDELTIGTVCSIEQLILDEDRPGVMAEVTRAVAENRSFTIEYRLKHKNGDIRWVSEYGMSVYGADGAPLFVDGVIFDITERKQTEVKIAEQLKELSRWHDVTSGREGRILDLKHEVNEILYQVGQPPRYPSAESQDQTKE